MRDKTSAVVIVSVIALALVAAGGLLIQTVLMIAVPTMFSDARDAVGEIHETLVDQEIDAGYAASLLNEQDPLLKARKVFLSHDINARAAADVSMRLILLNEIDPTSPIDLMISTQGGWADNAFNIVDTMRTIDAPVNTWAVGGCYSAGALILAAGTGTRYATENSIIMVHTNRDDSSEKYSFERLSLGRYEKLWRETASLPDDWFPMTSDRRYYVSPEEAVSMKIVDEVVPVW